MTKERGRPLFLLSERLSTFFISDPPNKHGCSTGTKHLSPDDIRMAELKSTLLFGVAIYFKTKRGAKSLNLVWFGFRGMV